MLQSLRYVQKHLDLVFFTGLRGILEVKCWKLQYRTLETPYNFLLQAGCMYVHGGVVNMSGNRRTGSLYKVWLVVPSLLELSWEKLLKTSPHIAQLSTLQLLHLGLTHTLIQRLK